MKQKEEKGNSDRILMIFVIGVVLLSVFGTLTIFDMVEEKEAGDFVSEEIPEMNVIGNIAIEILSRPDNETGVGET